MKLAAKISLGVTVVAALAASHPGLSAPPVAVALTASRPALSAKSMQQVEVGRGGAERSASAANVSAPAPAVLVPSAPASAFLPMEEGRLLALTNRERAARGLPPLYLNVSLREAARAHAREMALEGYIGHTSRYGLGVRDRMAQFVRLGPRIGENLAFVHTIEQAHTAFVGSWAHLHNMVNPAFRRVGIGVATMGEAGVMIAEDFADSVAPRFQPAPHRAWAIQSDRSTSSASTAPLTRSRSAR